MLIDETAFATGTAELRTGDEFTEEVPFDDKEGK
jgi:hypothetical protein